MAMARIQGTKTRDKIQKQIAVNVLDDRPLRTLHDDSFGAHPEAEGRAALRVPEAFKFLASFGAGMVKPENSVLSMETLLVIHQYLYHILKCMRNPLPFIRGTAS